MARIQLSLASKRFSPPAVLATIYAIFILLGAVALRLPWSNHGDDTLSDAFFTPMSAVTVTGTHRRRYRLCIFAGGPGDHCTPCPDRRPRAHDLCRAASVHAGADDRHAAAPRAPRRTWPDRRQRVDGAGPGCRDRSLCGRSHRDCCSDDRLRSPVRLDQRHSGRRCSMRFRPSTTPAFRFFPTASWAMWATQPSISRLPFCSS